MFLNIVVLVLSLLTQIGLMVFVDPDTQTGFLLHLWNILFALNTGLVIGSFFSLVLIFIAWIFKSSYDFMNKLFYKRGALFGVFISLLLILKFYNFLDKFIFFFVLIITIAIDLIVIEKND